MIFLKKCILIFLCSCSLFFVFGQKQANIWYFGQYAGLDFNTTPPTILANGQLNTNEGCSSIADPISGNLLFYTDGVTVWNQQHAIMSNGAGLKGDIELWRTL